MLQRVLVRGGEELGRKAMQHVFGPRSRGRQPPRVSGGVPLLGHMIEFSRAPFEMLMRARAECGAVAEFQLLRQPVVMLTGPEANEAFFRAPDDQICRREAYRVMTPIFGEGVVFDAPLPRMNQQLRMIMPMLRDHALRTYPGAIVEETRRAVRGWGKAGEVDVLSFMKELTIYTSTRCLIGDEFRQGITKEILALYSDLEAGVHPLAYILPNLPIPKFKRRDAARNRLQQLIAEMMRVRGSSGGSFDDGLQILMSTPYEDGSYLSAHELTGLITALILAGHHTSAGTAVWILVELLRNAQFLGPVREEIDEIMGSNSEVTYPMLREMGELGAVLKEVLRLHPPLIFLFRKVLRPFEFGGYEVSPGKMLCASPAVTHRIPEVFPEPDRFDPARYADESQNSPFAWIGFGGGKHKCTGNAFGTLQLKGIIATLLHDYDFELVNAPSSYRDNYQTATVLPEGPCLLRYRRRHDISKRASSRICRTQETVPTSKLRVIVDRHLCQGHAACVSEAPEIFSVNAESLADSVLDPGTTALKKTKKWIEFYPPTELNDQVVRAARYCPNHAIAIEEREPE